MRDDGKHEPGDPEGRRTPERRRGPRKTKGYVERATAGGHSGQGSDSVRPHLRDQLKLKALMQQQFPPPAPEERTAIRD